MTGLVTIGEMRNVVTAGAIPARKIKTAVTRLAAIHVNQQTRNVATTKAEMMTAIAALQTTNVVKETVVNRTRTAVVARATIRVH